MSSITIRNLDPAIKERPESRRRSDLEAAAGAMFLEDFEGCVLPFDMNASVAYADVFAAAGGPVDRQRQSIS